MARCELARTCPFFNDQQTVAHQTAEQFKARYCKGSSSECARYQVFERLCRDDVPFDMAPNDQMWARKIIAERQARKGPSNESSEGP